MTAPIDWITKKKLAQATGLSERSIEHYVNRGLIDSRKIGSGKNGRVLLSISSYNKNMSRQKVA